MYNIFTKEANKLKKAILLLHGFLSDTNDFIMISDMLEKNYDYVKKVVFPGHGPDEPYTLFNAQDTIKTLLNDFDELQKTYKYIDVMGYSMGGALGVYLSQVRDFNKLILLAPANKYFNFKMPFEKLVVYAKNFTKYFEAKRNHNVEELEETKKLLDSLVNDEKESVKVAFEIFFTRYLYGTYRNFRRLIKTINENIETIDNPCFIAWGTLDQLVPIDSVELLFSKCTNKVKEKKIYPYLNHLLLLSDMNEQLIKDLESFIKLKVTSKKNKF